MENYEYQDYKSLLEDITNGKYVINQPLKIDGNEISFLGNLLNYSHINKSNLHKILLSILNRNKTEIFKNNLNNNCSKMVEHVGKEWNLEKNDLFCDHDCCQSRHSRRRDLFRRNDGGRTQGHISSPVFYHA